VLVCRSGYIQYRDQETVAIAVAGMHGRSLDGREVKVDWARPSREFDETATRQPYTPPPKRTTNGAASGTSGGAGASSSSSSWGGGAGSAAAPAVPLGAITEVFDARVLHPNRRVESRDGTMIIIRSFESAPSSRSGLFAHIKAN
jgi:hypothetical protein